MEQNFSTDNLKKLLRQARCEPTNEPEFEQKLRRSLLNSRFFSENFITRWQQRLEFKWENWLLPITLGIIPILILGIIFNFIKIYKAPAGNAVKNYPVEMAAENTFSQWRQDGRLQYSRQDSDGSRIYLININNRQLELKDSYPYAINLTSQP